MNNIKQSQRHTTQKSQETMIQDVFLINDLLKKNKIVMKEDFNSKEIKMVLNCFKNTPLNYMNLNYVYNSSFPFTFDSFSKEAILKYIMIYIYFRFNRNYGSIQFIERLSECGKIIAKLFIDQYFSINEIITIAKLMLILGLCNQQKDNLMRLNKPITELKLIRIAFDLIMQSYKCKNILDNNDINAIISFLDYFNECVLGSPGNCIILSKTWNNFPLLPLMQKLAVDSRLIQNLSEKLQNIYIIIFKFQFKGILINYDKKTNNEIWGDLCLANTQIDYLKNCNLIENDKNRQKFPQFPNGFFFHEEGGNGLKISIKRVKDLSIVFSLKSVDSNIKKNKPLLSFYSPTIYEPILFFFLENDSLIIRKIVKDKPNDFITGITIQPLESYIFWIQLEYMRSNKKTQIKITTNSVIKKVLEIPTLGKEYDLECYIGCKIEIEKNPKYTKDNRELQLSKKPISRFIGEIGTVIFFSNKLSPEQERLLLELKEQYEQILFLGRFDMNNIKKYMNRDIFTDEMIDDTKNDIYEKTLCVVSPLNFQLNEDRSISKLIGIKDKKTFSFNYMRNNGNCMNNQNLKVDITSHFSNDFFLIIRKQTMVEFLKLNGINLLSLHLEYYYQLLCSLSTTTIKDDLSKQFQDKIINKMYIFI